MQVITSITQKGQVSLPKSFRELLGMKEYDRVMVTKGIDHIIIKPLEDVLDLAGSYKPKKRKSILKARVEFEKDRKSVV